jgi:hypothetical protein
MLKGRTVGGPAGSRHGMDLGTDASLQETIGLDEKGSTVANGRALHLDSLGKCRWAQEALCVGGGVGGMGNECVVLGGRQGPGSGPSYRWP